MSHTACAIIGIICFLVAFPLAKLERSFGLFGGFGPGATFKYGRLLAAGAVIGGIVFVFKAVG